MKRFLLDTNVAVWLLLGDRERVSGDAIEARAASVWEIAIKRSLGKLTIADGWARTLMQLGFDAMPVTGIHAEAVERLPWHHHDPFDRLLVAQASVERRALVTADRRLTAYGVEVLW